MELNGNGFPIETCSRCHGTGHHSYNQVNGTICFKCGGHGKCVTKKAKPAWIAFVANAKALKEISAKDLRVGQVACSSGSRIKKEIVAIEILDVYRTAWSASFTAKAISEGYKPEQCYEVHSPMIITFVDGTTVQTNARSGWTPVVTLADLNADFYLAQIPKARKAK